MQSSRAEDRALRGTRFGGQGRPKTQISNSICHRAALHRAVCNCGIMCSGIECYLRGLSNCSRVHCPLCRPYIGPRSAFVATCQTTPLRLRGTAIPSMMGVSFFCRCWDDTSLASLSAKALCENVSPTVYLEVSCDSTGLACQHNQFHSL